MIIHDFGEEQALQQALLIRASERPAAVNRPLSRLSMTKSEWADELSHKLYGERTPEQFFEAWDSLHSLESDDAYPPYPAHFLQFWCRDNQAFRRACRRLWREKQESLSYFADDVNLDPVSEGMVKLLTLSIYFAIAVAILNATQLPIDTMTFALVLMVFFFTYLIEMAVAVVFGVSGSIVRRALKRHKALQVLRQKASAKQ